MKDNEGRLRLSLCRNKCKLRGNGHNVYDIMFTILKQILFTDSLAQSLIRFTVIVYGSV